MNSIIQKKCTVTPTLLNTKALSLRLRCQGLFEPLLELIKKDEQHKDIIEFKLPLKIKRISGDGSSVLDVMRTEYCTETFAGTKVGEFGPFWVGSVPITDGNAGISPRFTESTRGTVKNLLSRRDITEIARAGLKVLSTLPFGRLDFSEPCLCGECYGHTMREDPEFPNPCMPGCKKICKCIAPATKPESE